MGNEDYSQSQRVNAKFGFLNFISKSPNIPTRPLEGASKQTAQQESFINPISFQRGTSEIT
jgi:hypothetical protein